MGTDGTDGTVNKYAVPLDALERSVNVPAGEQVEGQPEPPAPDAVPEDRLEMQRFLRLTP